IPLARIRLEVEALLRWELFVFPAPDGTMERIAGPKDQLPPSAPQGDGVVIGCLRYDRDLFRVSSTFFRQEGPSGKLLQRRETQDVQNRRSEIEERDEILSPRRQLFSPWNPQEQGDREVLVEEERVAMPHVHEGLRALVESFPVIRSEQNRRRRNEAPFFQTGNQPSECRVRLPERGIVS